MDSQVRELIALVNSKEEEIKSVNNQIWETNCIFKTSSSTTNIRSITKLEILLPLYKELLADFKNHNLACEDLGLDIEYSFNGYSISQWKNDFKNVIDKIEVSSKKKSLDQLKKKLDSLVSEEERKRIELENIKKELGI